MYDGLLADIILGLSQIIFFTFCFVLLRYALLKSRGLLDSTDTIRENAIQIGLMYVAIAGVVALLTVPLHGYEHTSIILPATIVLILCIIAYDLITPLRVGHEVLHTSAHRSPFDF
jgi:uncharacterized membrane protein